MCRVEVTSKSLLDDRKTIVHILQKQTHPKPTDLPKSVESVGPGYAIILADEYEKLEKEREVFAQENKFSKTKSASLTQVTCRRCEETDNQDTRGNDQWSLPHQARQQQATDAPRGGQWTPAPQQQRQPNNTLWRPPSNTQRPQDATHITDPQEACRKCGGNGHWARRCRNQRLLFCWICGKVGVRALGLSI